MRVIGADGAQIGVIQTHEALKLAEEAGLELVEVNPRAVPPVCKIMDFGKFKYETSKKEKASRKHQSTIVLKGIKLRPKTDDHDFDFKVKHIREFLAEGNKCKLVIVFRGRGIVHPETGQAMLDKVVKSTTTTSAMVEQRVDDGRATHGHGHRTARWCHPPDGQQPGAGTPPHRPPPPPAAAAVPRREQPHPRQPPAPHPRQPPAPHPRQPPAPRPRQPGAAPAAAPGAGHPRQPLAPHPRQPLGAAPAAAPGAAPAAAPGAAPKPAASPPPSGAPQKA